MRWPRDTLNGAALCDPCQISTIAGPYFRLHLSWRHHAPSSGGKSTKDGLMPHNLAARSNPIDPQLQQSPSPVTPEETIELGRQVIASEARAVLQLLNRLGAPFYVAVEQIRSLQGALIVTGMGKAGWIGQKLAATFASTGTRAHFLHPAEAFHGDLGRVAAGDVVLALSQSGETAEVLQLLAPLRTQRAKLIAITATKDNSLGRAAQVVLELGRLDEACSLGLAPSSSTAAMLALGDALALVVSRLRGFQAEDFARNHPGGSLGLQLREVEEQMRPLEQCRVARDDQSVRAMLAASTRPGRRSGAVMLTDASGRLTGIFTDSDLARLIESRRDAALDAAVASFMATTPTTIAAGSFMSDAIELLADRKISELPVVDQDGKPVGMIDVTDVVGLLPEPPAADDADAATGSIRILRIDDAGDSQLGKSEAV